MPEYKQADRSDAILSKKWDLVISNGLVKTGLGFGTGVVLSVLFFRRRAWPVWLGTGFGAGRGWAEGDAIFAQMPGVPAEAGVRDIEA